MSNAAVAHPQTEIRRRLACFVLDLLQEKSWSKEELGRAISVSGTAVQGWTGTNSDRISTVDPLAMKTGTFFALAKLRGWTGNQLYEFLTGEKETKPSNHQEELINLLSQAATIVKRGIAMRTWSEFLRDLSASLVSAEHRSRFADSAQISEGALDALLAGEMMLEKAEQVFMAVVECGFPILDPDGGVWDGRDAMIAYTEERIGRGGSSRHNIENGHHA